MQIPNDYAFFADSSHALQIKNYFFFFFFLVTA